MVTIPNKVVELDQTDVQIMKELQTNCRRSFRELSRVMGISPATLIERVKRLEKNGYILRYGTHFNLLKLGYEFMAIINISIDGGALLEVQQKISAFPGVAAVFDIAGEYDSLAIVFCKSRAELSALIKKILKTPRVKKTNTNMVLNAIKEMHQFEAV